MLKVCVIDDSEVVLSSVKMALKPLGWDVVTYSNALGVSFKIKQEDPDIVLVDVNMPVLSGPGLMKTLTSRVGPKRAKLLLHSDQPEDKLQQLAVSTKAHGFIKKTGDAKALDKLMRSFL